MDKSADAFRTITEAAAELDLPQHVLRFWETRFPQIRPLKRSGGRRYYRPKDIEVLRTIKHLLYGEGYTIKGVQRVLNGHGAGAGGTEGRIRLDPSDPSGRGLTGLQGSPLNGESGGIGPAEQEAPEAPVSPSRGLGRDDGAGKMSEGLSWPLVAPFGLNEEDLARLRAALAELVQCEEILAATRRK
jgi:DNA-binding transcriptional MerR regulator